MAARDKYYLGHIDVCRNLGVCVCALFMFSNPRQGTKSHRRLLSEKRLLLLSLDKTNFPEN